MMQIKTVIFMGTSQFAVPSLKLLASTRFYPSLCITQPDRPRGRNLKLNSTEVKKAALELDLPLYQPEDVNSNESLNRISELTPDIIITVAYGGYLKRTLRKIPVLGCINLHPSLLPKYRGAAPINFTLFNGEKITGNTIFRIVAKMDAGPVLYQSKLEISEEDNYSTLSEKLAVAGAEDLVKVITLLEENKIHPKIQDEEKVSFSNKLIKSDFLIDWNMESNKIRNRIKGLADKPGAFTFFRGKQLKILQARELIEHSFEKPGIIVDILGKKGIVVTTGSTNLLLEKVQPAGKKVMQAFEFNLGARIKPGEKFTNGI